VWRVSTKLPLISLPAPLALRDIIPRQLVRLQHVLQSAQVELMLLLERLHALVARLVTIRVHQLKLAAPLARLDTMQRQLAKHQRVHQSAQRAPTLLLERPHVQLALRDITRPPRVVQAARVARRDIILQQLERHQHVL